MKDPEPTPEDRERVRYQIAHAREEFEELLVRHEARRRVARERREQQEHRRQRLRRFIPFLG